mmetsp:Transcript_76306/g.165123  ORF Transcript_76306/g.165123 Transcript_76306/m.165123 type:complete len:81 (-) Transcript_76306:2-244(-)
MVVVLLKNIKHIKSEDRIKGQLLPGTVTQHDLDRLLKTDRLLNKKKFLRGLNEDMQFFSSSLYKLRCHNFTLKDRPYTII